MWGCAPREARRSARRGLRAPCGTRPGTTGRRQRPPTARRGRDRRRRQRPAAPVPHRRQLRHLGVRLGPQGVARAGGLVDSVIPAVAPPPPGLQGSPLASGRPEGNGPPVAHRPRGLRRGAPPRHGPRVPRVARAHEADPALAAARARGRAGSVRRRVRRVLFLVRPCPSALGRHAERADRCLAVHRARQVYQPGVRHEQRGPVPGRRLAVPARVRVARGPGHFRDPPRSSPARRRGRRAPCTRRGSSRRQARRRPRRGRLRDRIALGDQPDVPLGGRRDAGRRGPVAGRCHRGRRAPARTLDGRPRAPRRAGGERSGGRFRRERRSPKAPAKPWNARGPCSPSGSVSSLRRRS